jgi:hypothetical protein
MLYLFCEGPKEQWQAELDRLSRQGLIYFALQLIDHHEFAFGRLDRKSLIEAVGHAKKIGKSLAAIDRHNRYNADPDKFIDALVRRSRSAKRAARRRKKSAR